ncbi:MAG: xylan 1,4-beta-xylosidase [Clostridia bacterium]|nr:xylan 1,4-beta-xylosidase [Clostridia bacterium]
MSKLERFEVLLKEGSSLSDAGQVMILRDKETGVQYLWVKSGYAGGLTPLLDADGKPLTVR